MPVSRISDALVRRLKSAEKPYEVRDANLKGFLVRVQPSGVQTYYCEYGRGRRERIGRAGAMTPQRAREAAKKLLGAVAGGHDPAAARKAARTATLKAYINNEYGPWVRAHRKDGAATVARIDACFFGDFGSKRLDQITPWLLEKWRARRIKDGISPSTLNRDVAALRSALQRAVDWDLLPANPIAKVKAAKVDTQGKVRYLSRDEEGRLRKALDERERRIRRKRRSANAWRRTRGHKPFPELDGPFVDYLKPLVLVSLNTGLRRGEALSLRWGDVDLGRQQIVIHGEGAKSGKTRYIPLNREASEVLREWKSCGTDGGLVFPTYRGKRRVDLRKTWAPVLEAAGIQDFRWHDLRHSFASHLVMAGVDLYVVKELLGHSTIVMTERYAHLAPEHRAAAVERLVEARR